MPYLKLAFAKRALQKHENPFTLFECVRSRGAFLLQGSPDFIKVGGRFSFIGYDPFAKIWSSKGVTYLLKIRDFLDWKKSGSVGILEGDPLDVLANLLKHFQCNGKSPVPFCGGAIGYVGYDFGVRLAGIDQKVFDDIGLPDFTFFLADKIVAIDHEKSELYFLALASTDTEAERQLETMKDDFQISQPFVQAGSVGKIVSNLTYEQYEKKLFQIHRYLQDGETYQVNFSQRFSADCDQDPWDIYKALATINPAPYSCFFDFDDFQIISSSPELLLKKEGSKIWTKPIKGTIARGKNAKDDGNNVQQLLASAKDEAELAMIVDLERNDLGKVCDVGSVKVSAHRAIEKYARVLHTVSTVEGKLFHGKNFFDAFRALFPGGSITGCPKKRTMEIIDELEDFKRGVYTGSAGFVGFDGNGVMNILIRTMFLRDKKLYYHAGGGIVIDSDPKKEYEETFQKVLALREALEKSSRGQKQK